MLDGFSDEWTDAGDQRVASFANLAPGRYEFRVRAAVAGSGADPEAVWAFSVRPPFYQMAWFYVVCVTAVGLLLSGAWWMRVRAMRHEFALVVAERARVSRDIHDTLLQNLTGVGLELEVLASQLDTSLQGTPSAALRGLRRRVGRCIVEARRSILELRATPHCRDLISGLRDFVEEVGIGQEAAIGVDVTGAVRRLPADVEEQFLRIAQEAAHNAIRHAGARTIRIALAYRATGASLRVSDDGCGFVQVNGEEPDGEHWGLRNMQERAARISARLTLTSSPGRGTTVDVDVTLDA
jgi:signal transduction histidine kinase